MTWVWVACGAWIAGIAGFVAWWAWFADRFGLRECASCGSPLPEPDRAGRRGDFCGRCDPASNERLN